MQSVLSYYVLSNGLQKIEKKKRKQAAFERGGEDAAEFCCNTECFLPKTLFGFKWCLKLETTVCGTFHQIRRIKIELVLL